MKSTIEKRHNPLYALTWCPKPRQTWGPEAQARDHIRFLKTHRAYEQNICLQPELTKEGNVHWHGIYSVESPIRWFRNTLPAMKRKGFLKIKPVFDLDKWVEYCLKDSDLMGSLLGNVCQLPVMETTLRQYKHNDSEMSIDEVLETENYMPVPLLPRAD